jgi:hypothetical protein
MGLINPGKGNEALGGWTVSWCKEKWWGSILAVSSGHSGIIKVSCVQQSQGDGRKRNLNLGAGS